MLYECMETNVETLIFYAFYIHWRRRHPHTHTLHISILFHIHMYKYIYNHYSCFKNNLSNVTTSLVHDFILMALLQWIRERNAIHAHIVAMDRRVKRFQCTALNFCPCEYVHISFPFSLPLSCFSVLHLCSIRSSPVLVLAVDMFGLIFCYAPPPPSSICSHLNVETDSHTNANAFQHVYFRYLMLDVLDAFVCFGCVVWV